VNYASMSLKVQLCSAIFASVCLAGHVAAQTPAPAKRPTMSEVLKASQPSDWRPLDADNTLYLELASGRVIIELAPNLAPNHVANIKALAKEGYFDGLAIIRSQDNYVVQWGDPDEKKPVKTAKRNLEGEFTVKAPKDFAFTRLPDADGYAPQAGFSNGFHVGRDPKEGTAWLAHCYGAVGVGRGNETNSGDGTSLYVVTGHAPRHLDRNITVVGRVVQGMPLLSSLPRGTGNLGFYDKPQQNVPIKTVRIAADVPEAERTALEMIRTDTKTFTAAVEALRNRGGDWFKVPAGHVELCNVPISVRPIVLSGKS
jgi:cyclophilin family peptidyl-prolyl cis-trans isomerase